MVIPDAVAGRERPALSALSTLPAVPATPAIIAAPVRSPGGVTSGDLVIPAPPADTIRSYGIDELTRPAVQAAMRHEGLIK